VRGCIGRVGIQMFSVKMGGLEALDRDCIITTMKSDCKVFISLGNNWEWLLSLVSLPR